MGKLPSPPIMPNVPGEGVHALRDVVPGLDKEPVFEAISGDVDQGSLWDSAFVVCFRGEGYPRVDDHTGHILCPDAYAASYDPLIVYLDLVHELVHVRQLLEGREVYHFPEPYVQWPTEIEAYRVTYEEAKRLGVGDEWFWGYLAVPWVEEEDLLELAGSIGLPVVGAVADEEADDEGARH